MSSKSKQTSKPATPKVEMPNKSLSNTWLMILSMVGIALLTYITFNGALTHDFVNWDDQVYVEEQPLVLQKEYKNLCTTPVSLNYHPITMMSLAMQVPNDAKKLSPKPFIQLNIWLHIFNSLLVFLLIWWINDKKWWMALFTALIFAVHPMHVESVVWVSERKDVLYTFFFLLSCLAYWKYLKDEKWSWLGLTFLLVCLSILSKAVAVVLPLVFILLDYWKGRNFKQSKVWLEKLPFFAMSIFFGMMAISVQSGGDFGGILTLHGDQVKALADHSVFTVLQRFQFASYGFVQYIYKFFVPIHLSAFYPYPVGYKLDSFSAIFYPILVLIFIGLSIWSTKKTKIFAFSLGFYFVNIALVLQFLSVGLALMADRYTYVPYIGLTFGCVYVLDQYLMAKSNSLKWAMISILVIITGILSIATQTQVKQWKNSETLWTQVLNQYPTTDLALANRGNYRGKTGNIQGAMADFEAAIADGCERADVYEGLGNCYGTLSMQANGNRESNILQSIKMYKKALEIDSTKGNIYVNLAITQLSFDPESALISFQKALQTMPHKEAQILPGYGVALINTGKYQEAINVLTKAIQLSGASDELLYNRAIAFINVNNNEAAKSDLQQVLTINPNHQNARDKLVGL